MDLTFLRPLYEPDPLAAPWAAVYLDASRDTEDAAHAVDLRWRAAREELAAAGADEATLDAIAEVATTPTGQPGGHGLAIFASRGRVVLTQVLPAAPASTITAWAPLPHTMPMIGWLGERVPWLRVVVDRTGADLIGATEGGVTRRATVRGGHQYPIRKVNAGGWSHRRYQESAEVTWDRNAAEIAEAVVELADRTGAEVLIVAGDIRERQLLMDRLPERWADRVVQTDAGSRAAGADPEPLDEATVLAVAERAQARTDEVLDRFRTELGRGPAAGVGLAAVVTALQRGQVDTVLIADDPSSTARLWIGPAPTDIASERAQLRDLGVAEPIEVRADAALVRALAGTDANIVLTDPNDVELGDGVGALLRYADASTRRN